MSEILYIESQIPNINEPILVWDYQRKEYNLIYRYENTDKIWISQSNCSWAVCSTGSKINISFDSYIKVDNLGLTETEYQKNRHYKIDAIVLDNGYSTFNVSYTANLDDGIKQVNELTAKYKEKNVYNPSNNKNVKCIGYCIHDETIVNTNNIENIVYSTCPIYEITNLNGYTKKSFILTNYTIENADKIIKYNMDTNTKEIIK